MAREDLIQVLKSCKSQISTLEINAYHDHFIRTMQPGDFRA